MSPAGLIPESFRPTRRTIAALITGAYAASVSLVGSLEGTIAWLAPLGISIILGVIVLAPNLWLPIFFAAALLLPPLPIPLGDSGPHAAMGVAALGLFAGFLQLPRWKFVPDAMTLSFIAFTGVLASSVALAAIYSGAAIAFSSLARVCLFGISCYIFLYVSNGPFEISSARRWGRFLFLLAVLAAIFACLDFYFQFPAPAQFGPQFVWLDSGVYRRAQGLFYEASTLGNFCAFFLIMIAVALRLPRAERPCSPLALVVGGLALSAALIFSYSRASLLNLLVAILALAYVRQVRWTRLLLLLLAGLASGGWIVYAAFPSFAANYWTRLVTSVQYFWSTPEGVLSGRVASWQTLVGFAMDNPWTVIFGVGYKTLPYSEIAGRPVIADNMYLSLLLEIGVVGWFVFLFWNAAILRASWRAAKSQSDTAKFYGTWMFCFWIGQLFQMLSGDLLTYWRVLPVYFLVLGIAVRATREDSV